jgi:hypothetical protein
VKGSARRWVILAVVLALAVAGATAAVIGALRGQGSPGGSGDSGSATSLATVRRQNLSKQTQVPGMLGYAGSYSVLGQGHGTVTWLPAVGQVIDQGQALFQVDGAPVVLLFGSTPAWRALVVGVSGPDAAQLNHALVTVGDMRQSDVDSTWDQFTWATAAGVARLQAHLGAAQSGSLALGEVVFLPTAARVTELHAGLGGPATGPVLSATSTTPAVTVALDADRRSDVKPGDEVAITLPDGQSVPGRVTAVGTVATTSSSGPGGPGSATPTVPVTIQPTDPAVAAGLDQAPVLVTITTITVQDVLAVPVNALLAVASGGYAVEVVDGDGNHRLVPVTPGLFDDASGLVQISGSGLAEGQHVVVPGS